MALFPYTYLYMKKCRFVNRGTFLILIYCVIRVNLELINGKNKCIIFFFEGNKISSITKGKDLLKIFQDYLSICIVGILGLSVVLSKVLTAPPNILNFHYF